MKLNFNVVEFWTTIEVLQCSMRDQTISNAVIPLIAVLIHFRKLNVMSSHACLHFWDTVKRPNYESTITALVMIILRITNAQP